MKTYCATQKILKVKGTRFISIAADSLDEAKQIFEKNIGFVMDIDIVDEIDDVLKVGDPEWEVEE